MREFFSRVEDGSEVQIEVDMNAYAYSRKYSWLFSVFIKFDAAATAEQNYEEFLETKESLIIALEHDERAKFVGMRIVDGWSELYFYAEDSRELDTIVAKMLKGSNYIYESNVVKDNKWDFHYNNLNPTDLELAHIQSQKIIFLLEEEGDDLSLSRPVEHYVSFTTPTQKNRFINLLNLEGFSYKDDIESDEFEHGVALVKEHILSAEVVKENIEELYKLVKQEGGYYEGWSTLLAKETTES